MTCHPLYALLAVAVVGCSNNGYRVAPVSGRVTLNGQPAANVHVEFLPDGGGKILNPGPGSIGVTNAQGIYLLNCVQTKEKGAVVGPHRVVLTVQASGAADVDEVVRANQVTAAKGKPSKTPPPQAPPPSGVWNRTYEVSAGGTDKADFELSSK